MSFIKKEDKLVSKDEENCSAARPNRIAIDD